MELRLRNNRALPNRNRHDQLKLFVFSRIFLFKIYKIFLKRNKVGKHIRMISLEGGKVNEELLRLKIAGALLSREKCNIPLGNRMQ